MTQANMSMVIQALKNAGLNDNQARILGAEIGRENGFQSRYLWGYHTDPQNKAKNIGIISWQGSRAEGVERALRNAGLIKDGKIVQNQAALDVQAKYLVNEIRTNSAYAETKKKFLDNPNVDYATGSRVLGKNFIRWAYDNPKYASGHTSRDRYYAQLGGVQGTGDPIAQALNRAARPVPQVPDFSVGAPVGAYTVSAPVADHVAPTVATPLVNTSLSSILGRAPTQPVPVAPLMGGPLFSTAPTALHPAVASLFGG